MRESSVPARFVGDTSENADALLKQARHDARTDYLKALRTLQQNEPLVQSLDLLSRFEVRRFEAELRYEQGQHAAVQELFGAFQRSERPPGNHRETFVRRWAEGMAAYYASDYSSALSAFAAASESIPEDVSKSLRAEFHFDYASVLSFTDKNALSASEFETSEALFLDSGREEDAFTASILRLDLESDNPEGLARYLDQVDVALGYFAERGDLATQSWLLYEAGISHTGTYASTLESLNLARQYARETHCLMTYLVYTTSTAEVYLMNEQLADARELIAEARKLTGSVGDHEARAEVARIAGAIAREEGRFEDAERELNRALALFNEVTPEHDSASWVRMDLALLFEKQERYEAALEVLAPAEAWFGRDPNGAFYWEVLDYQIRFLRKLGRFEEALAKYDMLYDISYREWESGISERLALATVQHEKSLREAQVRSLESEKRTAEADRARQAADLARLDAENERNRMSRDLALAGSGFGLLIGLMLLLLILRERSARSRLTEANRTLGARNLEIATEVARRNQANHDLLAANAALKELDEERKLLLGTTVHELRNPASAVLTGVELLRDEWRNRSDGKAYELIELIREAGDNLLQIVNRIVTLRDPHPIPGESENDYFDPRIVIEQTVYLNQLNAARKDQEITLKMSEDVELWGRSNALREVLDNLLSNAVKYAPLGDRIAVSLTSPEADVTEIRVQDGGPGIPPTERDRLFLPFARLSTRPTGGEASSGLGLFSAKRACDSMDADLTLESNSRRGTCFLIRFRSRRQSDALTELASTSG
jgi:signal transduction histidine kinase